MKDLTFPTTCIEFHPIAVRHMQTHASPPCCINRGHSDSLSDSIDHFAIGGASIHFTFGGFPKTCRCAGQDPPRTPASAVKELGHETSRQTWELSTRELEH